MKRTAIFLLSLTLLLSGCSAASYQESPQEEELTAQAVLDAYQEAAQVYDWFDLCSMPAGMEAIQTEDGIYYPVEEPGIETLADLEARVRACFAPDLAGGNPVSGEQLPRYGRTALLRPLRPWPESLSPQQNRYGGAGLRGPLDRDTDFLGGF